MKCSFLYLQSLPWTVLTYFMSVQPTLPATIQSKFLFHVSCPTATYQVKEPLYSLSWILFHVTAVALRSPGKQKPNYSVAIFVWKAYNRRKELEGSTLVTWWTKRRMKETQETLTTLKKRSLSTRHQRELLRNKGQTLNRFLQWYDNSSTCSTNF